MFIKTCKQCSVTFEAKDRRRNYCGTDCYNEMERAATRRRYANYSPTRKKAILAAAKMASQPCEICGLIDADAHHDDYAKPTEVRWLCRSHHKQHHCKFGPGLNA